MCLSEHPKFHRMNIWCPERADLVIYRSKMLMRFRLGNIWMKRDLYMLIYI